MVLPVPFRNSHSVPMIWLGAYSFAGAERILSIRMSDSQREDEPRYEVVGMALWRRLFLGGEGPELTLAEAAAALGVSEQTVRRRIKSGELVARRDASGRYRVVPLLCGASDEAREALFAWADEVMRMEAALQETRERLKRAEALQTVLSTELDQAREAEAVAQAELSGLWQRIESGMLRHMTGRDGEEEDRLGMERVRNVVFDARALFKRRRHRWPLVG